MTVSAAMTASGNMQAPYVPGRSVAPYFEDITRDTKEKIIANLSYRVEVIVINDIAFWSVTAILIWLIITISVQQKYYGGMMRNIECIADVLVLIAGSERLLAVIREREI